MDPLREAARSDPSGPAAVVAGRTAGGDRTFSWREVDALADLAAFRLTQLGVGPGSLVATLLDPGLDAFVLLHALPRVGGTLVPLHPGWTEVEQVRALTLLAAGPGGGLASAGAVSPLLVLAPDAVGRAVGAKVPGAGFVDVEEVVGALPDPDAAAWRPSDPDLGPDTPVALILTSGSTGLPRPVPLTHGNLMASARGAAHRLRLDPADRWLASLAVAHVGGLALLHRGAVVGSVTVFDGGGRFDPARFLELAHRGEVTHASLVPVMLQRLLDAGGKSEAPRGLRCVLLGGAATPAPLLDRALAARWPVALTWGMTEASSQVATAPPDQLRRKPGSVGRPLPGLAVRVVRSDGGEAKVGEVGELLVSGPTVAPLPAVEAAGGWLRTGDLGRFDVDGDLWITGRASDRILSGAVTVEPGEVEAALLRHPEVREAAVVGMPDPEWGEQVVAFVVPAHPAAPPEVADLVAHGRMHLASAKRPRVVHLVPALPRNANGKVDRGTLRKVALSPGPDPAG
ncbi:MAG: o-succinylbenzoate--CoA ligase [Gemmatimonadales bacterium]|nr:MAG: o-succinylbenzoate--CoA ligase [Gemmatimonadales bacterium]